MTNLPQQYFPRLVRAAIMSVALLGCGGQGTGTTDAGSGSTGADTTAPQLIQKSPDSGQTNVSTNEEIVLTFSEPLNSSLISATAINLYVSNPNTGQFESVVKGFRWDAQSNTLFVRPSTFFVTDRHYRVDISNSLRDLAGNQLDAGSAGVISWRFTTGTTFDDQPPAWNADATVRRVVKSFDTITVCWWSGQAPATDPGCDSTEVDALPPAAVDVPNNGSNNVLYTVEYRRASEATFSQMSTGLNARRVTLTDLTADTDYDIRLRARDTAGNAVEQSVAAASVRTPKAGRLYAANNVGNRLSIFSGAGQAAGDKAADVVTADRTGLAAPAGIAVDRIPDPNDPTRQIVDPDGYVYVAETDRNRIAAYKLSRAMDTNGDGVNEVVKLGDYGLLNNPEPDWTIEGSLTTADRTGLCGPSTLHLERVVDAGGNVSKFLYVANSLAMSVSGSPPCRPDTIVVFRVTTPPQGTNQAPATTIKRRLNFFAPIGFVVDRTYFDPTHVDPTPVDHTHGLLYVANRDDKSYVTDNQGWKIDVYAFQTPLDGTSPPFDDNSLDQAPSRQFWGSADGPCVTPVNEPPDRICGPTSLAYDEPTDTLFVANRNKHNILVFKQASRLSGRQEPIVVQGLNTGLVERATNNKLDYARPVGLYLDEGTFTIYPDETWTYTLGRLYVTTDDAQSVLIYDATEILIRDALPIRPSVNAPSSDPPLATVPDIRELNLLPLRVIQGTKTMLGQPARAADGSRDVGRQSSGPFAITVARNADGVNEAYVVTSGIFHPSTGLTPVPTVAMLNVSANKDPDQAPSTLLSRTTNTVPDRVVINPLLGAGAVALDAVEQRLYVAGFHSNMIAVYDDPLALSDGRTVPSRVIAGPATMLDHPIALAFRRRDANHPGSLYVVNQSSHTVTVFEERGGIPTGSLLGGNTPPSRYVGPPEGTNPFTMSVNLTQMAYPTGLAIDPDNGILYVSNRDAEQAQDVVGRRIVAFTGADTIGLDDGIPATEDHNVAPTWKIEGVDGSTDRTLLRRPAGLFLIPDPNPGDAVRDDRLVVANRGGGSILIFQGVSAHVAAPPADSNLAPTWTMTSSLSSPVGLAFDPGRRDLYVADLNRILAFHVPATAAPSATARIIQGSSTGLWGPIGLALDPDH